MRAQKARNVRTYRNYRQEIEAYDEEQAYAEAEERALKGLGYRGRICSGGVREVGPHRWYAALTVEVTELR